MGTLTMAAHQVSFTPVQFCYTLFLALLDVYMFAKRKFKSPDMTDFNVRSWFKLTAHVQYGVNLSLKLPNHLCLN